MPDPVEVTVLVGVDVSVIVVDPVPLLEPVFDELAPVDTDAVGEEDIDRERLCVELAVDDDVGVFEVVIVPVPVCDGVAGGVVEAVIDEDDVGDDESDCDGVPLAEPPID